MAVKSPLICINYIKKLPNLQADINKTSTMFFVAVNVTKYDMVFLSLFRMTHWKNVLQS